MLNSMTEEQVTYPFSFCYVWIYLQIVFLKCLKSCFSNGEILLLSFQFICWLISASLPNRREVESFSLLAASLNLLSGTQTVVELKTQKTNLLENILFSCFRKCFRCCRCSWNLIPFGENMHKEKTFL